MNIVRFGKDAFKKTIGIPQQVARFLGDQDSRRTASMQNALQGAPVDGNKIDFAAQTEQLKEAAQLGPQQPSMGRRVLTSFLDYAKSPEGQQSLMDLASIVLASQKSDPFEASAITQQLQETIKQRPILEQQRLEREQAAAEKAQAEIDENIKKVTAQENLLRKEFIQENKEFKTAKTQKEKLSRSLNRGTAAGDLAAIFAFMKLLDPPSVVREGEQATARNASGVPERIRNQYNRLLKGNSLTPLQRKDFRKTSEEVYKPLLLRYKDLTTIYKDIAKRQNLNPKNIIYKLSEDKLVTDTVADTVTDTDITKISTEDLKRIGGR